MKVRIVYRADGGVSIIHHAPKSSHTYEQAMDKAMQGELEGCEYEDIEQSEVPADRKYRDAWRKEKGKAFTLDATVKAAVDAQRTLAEQKLINAKMREMAEEALIEEGTLEARVGFLQKVPEYYGVVCAKAEIVSPILLITIVTGLILKKLFSPTKEKA